jgi:phosphoglycerate dehydrogenase-like enzyme
MKILVQRPNSDEELNQIIRDAAGDENSVVFANSDEEYVREAADAEILFGGCSEELFKQMSNLKWIQSSSAGMDSTLHPALINSDVILTNAAGLYGSHVADQGFALLLALARGIDQFARNQDQRKWGGGRPMIELGGFTIGIVGMGGIGQHMARRAKGFEMYVISVDAYRTDKPDVVDELMPIDQLPNLMSRADVVMIACPLTDETRGLIT